MLICNRAPRQARYQPNQDDKVGRGGEQEQALEEGRHHHLAVPVDSPQGLGRAEAQVVVGHRRGEGGDRLPGARTGLPEGPRRRTGQRA